MICINCGKEIKDGAKFCPYCGAGVENSADGQLGVQTAKKIPVMLIVIIVVCAVAAVLLFVNRADDSENAVPEAGDIYVVFEAQTDATDGELNRIIEDTKAILLERMEERRLSGAIVSIENDRYIRVSFSVADNMDADAEIQTLRTKGNLQFKLADGTVALDGSDISDSRVEQDAQNGGDLITLEFTSEGERKLLDATTKAYNEEVTVSSEAFPSGEVYMANQIAIMIDDLVLTAPSVESGPISGGDAVITRGGGFDQDYANQISMLIRTGMLPVELVEVKSGIVGSEQKGK